MLTVSNATLSGTLSLSSTVILSVTIGNTEDVTVRTGALAIYADTTVGVTGNSVLLSNQSLPPIAGEITIDTAIKLFSLDVNTPYYLIYVVSDDECAEVPSESIGTYGPITLDPGVLDTPDIQTQLFNTTMFIDCPMVPNAIGYEVEYSDDDNVNTIAYKTHGVHPIRGLVKGKTYTFKAKSLGDNVSYLSSDWSDTVEVEIAEDKKVQSLKFNIETRTSPWYYGQPKTQRSAIRTYVKCTDVVDIADGEETPSKVSSAIFAYRLCNNGEFFDHVCSSVDMIEMGEGTPEYGVRPQWVRRDYIDMLVPCVEISDECIRKIKEDIYYLAKEITSYITTIGTGYDAIEVDYEV